MPHSDWLPSVCRSQCVAAGDMTGRPRVGRVGSNTLEPGTPLCEAVRGYNSGDEDEIEDAVGPVGDF